MKITTLFYNILAMTICSLLVISPCTAHIVEEIGIASKTFSHYDHNKRLETVENYTLNGKEYTLTSIERLEWHPNFQQHIISRSLEDSEGNLLISENYFYDEKGALIENTVSKHTEKGACVLQANFPNEKCQVTKTGTKTYPSLTSYNVNSYGPVSNFFGSIVEYFNLDHIMGDDTNILLRLSGHSTRRPESALYGDAHYNDKVRITFINGLLTDKSQLMDHVKYLSRTHGNSAIHYVFRPTEGFGWDLLKSSLMKLGITSPEAETLAKAWKSLIEEMGGVDSDGEIVHYAHSIGGTNTYAAKFLLSPEEQRKIRVVTLGSPTVIPKGGFRKVTNYMSVRDGIVILDPLAQLMALFLSEDHVNFTGTYYGVPFFDHLLAGATYRKVIKSHGKAFIKHYGKVTLE